MQRTARAWESESEFREVLLWSDEEEEEKEEEEEEKPPADLNELV